MSGCHSCPVRCHSAMDVPSVETKYGLPRYATNTCVGWSGPRGFARNYPDPMTQLEATMVGKHMAHDILPGAATRCYSVPSPTPSTMASLKAKLPEAEYKAIPWEQFQGQPRIHYGDLPRRMAFREGVLGKALADGPGPMAQQMEFPAEYYANHTVGWWKMGHPYHHSSESEGQAGVLYNMLRQPRLAVPLSQQLQRQQTARSTSRSRSQPEECSVPGCHRRRERLHPDQRVQSEVRPSGR